MTTFIGTPPVSTSSLVLYLDSWNQRCLTGYNPSTNVPNIKDLCYPDGGNASVNNVHYLPNTKDLYYDGTYLLTMPGVGNYNNVFSAAGTVCAVIKPNSTGPSNNGRIVGKSSDGSEYTNGWWLNVYNSSGGYAALKFARMTTTGNLYGLWTTGQVIKLGSAHFVAVQYNDASISTAPVIYVDGNFVPVTATQSPTGTTGTDDTTSSMQMGNGLGLTRGYEGNINVIMAYKRTLSRDELAKLLASVQDRYNITRSY